MNPLIILDRDGVINQDSDAYVKSADEWIALPGSIEAIAKLCQAGFTIAVATNQSGLGRGYFDLDDLEAMHNKMCQLVEHAGGVISAITYCPHTPDDHCNCRKPAAGLIDAIERELQQPVADAYLIGDSLRDLQAGIARNCKPVLVKTGKGEKTIGKLKEQAETAFQNILIYPNLATAADAIIRQKSLQGKK